MEALTGAGKATMLNERISMHPSLHCLQPIAKPFISVLNSLCPNSHLCSEDDILKMLLAVDTSKAPGPDGVSSWMLKATAHSTVPSLTQLFNISITTGKIPGK